MAKADVAGYRERGLRECGAFQQFVNQPGCCWPSRYWSTSRVVLYESYGSSLTILSGIPSAGVGALLTLIIFKVDLNVVFLCGSADVSCVWSKRTPSCRLTLRWMPSAERQVAGEAIYEGCLVRFRPIMMTTMAALLGAVPSRWIRRGWRSPQAAGISRCWGLMLSQLVTYI